MRNRKRFIYKTTNLLNKKIYIGQRYGYPNSKYLGSGTAIIKAIKKYGESNFSKEILEYCESEHIANEREIYWIDYFNSTDRKIGYNISIGGGVLNRISDHPDKENIIKRRVDKWKLNYSTNEKLKQLKKKQGKELSEKYKYNNKGKCKEVVELDDSLTVINKYKSITEAVKITKILGLSKYINKRRKVNNKYFQFFNLEGKYNNSIPFIRKICKNYNALPNKGSFKKGNIPWNNGIKGSIKVNSGSFKKGIVPWNKGIDYNNIRGKNHHYSKSLLQMDEYGNIINYFVCVTDAVKNGFNRKGIKRASKNNSLYKGYKWKINENRKDKKNRNNK